MSYYPVLLDLKNKACLVVGGGLVAERKIKSLLSCGARVRVISPDLTLNLKEMESRKEFEYIKRNFQQGDTRDFFIVICATDDEETNSLVSKECQQFGRPVNVVDDPQKCSFIVPAVVRQGALTIAVSTGGKSPLLAAKIRRRLESEFGTQYAELLDLLGVLREKILDDVKDPKQRLNLFEALLDNETLALLEQGSIDEVKERVLNAYCSFRSKP